MRGGQRVEVFCMVNSLRKENKIIVLFLTRYKLNPSKFKLIRIRDHFYIFTNARKTDERSQNN